MQRTLPAPDGGFPPGAFIPGIGGGGGGPPAPRPMGGMGGGGGGGGGMVGYVPRFDLVSLFFAVLQRFWIYVQSLAAWLRVSACDRVW